MNLRKTILIGYALTVALTASAQNTIENDSTEKVENFNFSLEECILYAIENSHQRESLRLSEEAARATYRQSKKNRLPSVSASAGESASHTGTNSDINFSGNAGVNASIPIYQGGSIKNTIKQNQRK